MKSPKALLAQEWQDFNQWSTLPDVGQWYVNFAFKTLLPAVKHSKLYAKASTKEQKLVTIMLTNYLYDVVAQSGGWKAFTDNYRSFNNGRPLPFYPQRDDYAAGGFNPEDVAFVLWMARHDFSYSIVNILDINLMHHFPNPSDSCLLETAAQFCNLLQQQATNAPAGQQPTLMEWLRTDYTRLAAEAEAYPPEKPESELKEEVRRFLQHNGGDPLAFAKDYGELDKIMTEKLGWEAGLFPDLNASTDFVVYANSKGVMIAPQIAVYIKHDSNPCYNAERAADKGYRLFLDVGYCPIDLLRYAMVKGLLPDVQLPLPDGRKLLHENWQFILLNFLSFLLEEENEPEEEDYLTEEDKQ